MNDWIEEGQKAPAFSLQDDRGRKVKLSDFKGSVVVLYFYPRDLTPGCTRQACSFRDCQKEMLALGAVVLGVSTDSVESHQRFRDQHELNFSLLSDPEHKVSQLYGAWCEKNMYGKKSMGIQRSTYLIAPDGKVAKVWKRVQVDGHDASVLQAIRDLQNV
jgi:peroxiredoxin Q/BCP